MRLGKRWEVVGYDPFGAELKAKSRFWTRRGAQDAWAWLTARPTYIQLATGEHVRLVRYKVRRCL